MIADLTRRANSLSLGIKLLIPGLLALAVFVAALTLFWNARLANALQAGADDTIASAISFMSPPLVDAVWDFNDDLAEMALAPFPDLPGAVFAHVYSEGEVFAEISVSDDDIAHRQSAIATLLSDTNTTSMTVNDVTYVLASLDIGDRHVGDLVLGFDQHASRAILTRSRLIAILIGVVAFFSFGAVLYANTLQATRPLSRLLDHLAALRDGSYGIDIPEASREDEIGKLGLALEQLRDAEKDRQKQAALDRAAAQEQQRVVATLSQSMAELATGKLTVKIETEFPEAYDDLKTYFNQSTDALRTAIVEIFDVGEEIANGAQEVYSASDSLASQAEQQAVNSQEASAALTQVTGAMGSIRDICRDAKSEASNSQTAVRKNSEVVDDAILAMGDIKDATQKIVEIAAQIDQIAFQTNLLALNAGVEAARSGDAGRGFAIVASEVRNLAGQTSDMATQISGLINQSKETVGRGVVLVEEAGEAMTGVGERVYAMSGFIDNIASSIEEQTDAMGDLNSAITEVDNMTQYNAALAEETLAASQSMESVGKSLTASIGKFDAGLRDAEGEGAKSLSA